MSVSWRQDGTCCSSLRHYLWWLRLQASHLSAQEQAVVATADVMALRLRGSSDKEADVEPFVKPDGAGGLKYLLMCTDGLSNACTEAQV